MKKHILIIALAAGCIALAIAWIQSNQRIHALQDAIADLKSTGKVTITNVVEQTVLANIPVPVRKGPNEEGAIETIPSEEPPAETSSEDSGRRVMENLSAMMENPTMNQVLEASQRGTIGVLYTDLIDELDLNDEEMRYFMDLIMHRQMKQVDLALKLMSGDLSEEERATLEAEIEDARQLVSEEMERFLNNPDDYAEFEYYEKTLSERMMLSQVVDDLSGTEATFSDETYRQLLDLMYDERQNFQYNSDLADEQNLDMSAERFSEANLANYAEDMRRLNENIGSKAQMLLTPEQYEAFIRSLDANTELQISQLEMASQLFGGGE